VSASRRDLGLGAIAHDDLIANDISKGSYGFHKVKTALAGAHSILTSTAYLRAGIINARRSGQSVHLRSRYETDDLSILSTVMGITQEVCTGSVFVGGVEQC
jgi:hypothetical protein